MVTQSSCHEGETVVAKPEKVTGILTALTLSLSLRRAENPGIFLVAVCNREHSTLLNLFGKPHGEVVKFFRFCIYSLIS